jgi:hypothetical protein
MCTPIKMIWIHSIMHMKHNSMKQHGKISGKTSDKAYMCPTCEKVFTQQQYSFFQTHCLLSCLVDYDDCNVAVKQDYKKSSSKGATSRTWNKADDSQSKREKQEQSSKEAQEFAPNSLLESQQQEHPIQK